MEPIRSGIVDDIKQLQINLNNFCELTPGLVIDAQIRHTNFWVFPQKWIHRFSGLVNVGPSTTQKTFTTTLHNFMKIEQQLISSLPSYITVAFHKNNDYNLARFTSDKTDFGVGGRDKKMKRLIWMKSKKKMQQ